MGVIFLGDTHGFFRFFREMMKNFDHDIPFEIVQVGDFGYWPGYIEQWPNEFPWKTYFIAGNHEYYPHLRYDEVTQLKNNLFFVPRGEVLEIHGYTMGFVGGGFSVDKRQRKEGISWFPEEEVTEEDIAKLQNVQLDYLVTHTPPSEVILTVVGKLDKKSWGLYPEDVDTSAMRIQKLWENLGKPQLISGHLHRSAVGPQYRVLDINEVYIVPPRYELSGSRGGAVVSL